MSINVPQDSIEKPLTAIDYIVALGACDSTLEIGIFAEQVPYKVLVDDRFAKAVKAKLDAIREKKKAA